MCYHKIIKDPYILVMASKFNRLLFLCFIVFFQLIIGCKDEQVKPQNEFLVSSQNILTRSAADLKLFLSGTSLASLPADDVTLYKITYNTNYKAQQIIASGLVALPKTSAAVGMISFQHGTIAAHSEAPSVASLGSTDMIIYAGLASPGFIAVVPDYIGFGSSSSVLHPYYVEEPTASAIVDMIKAAKELAREQSINFNGKLFLAGYSQGGYATMATHKSIEQNGLPGFNLIASFPAAGGYDIKSMQEYFFGLTSYDQPFYIAYVALAYKTQYASWTAPLSDFFNEPFATKIPGLFDGAKNGSQINGELTNTISQLINADLKAGIDTDPKYKYAVDAFQENSLVDWRPAIRMFMYHGDADVTVPYNNSVITYQKLLSNGASPSIVTLTKLPGANHSSGVLSYIQGFVPIMLSLK